MDCSRAGYLLQHLLDLNVDSMEDDTKDVFFLGACGRTCSPALRVDSLETLPTNSDFPADLFTACLTDPLRISIRWCLHMRNLQPFSLTKDLLEEDNIEEDFAYRLEGGNVELEKGGDG